MPNNCCSDEDSASFIINIDNAVAGSLQIRRSQESDEGKYECVAENSAGVAYSYGANLYVRGMTVSETRYSSSILL